MKFARVPEPEFPGHVLLEQYQAQVCKHVVFYYSTGPTRGRLFTHMFFCN